MRRSLAVTVVLALACAAAPIAGCARPQPVEVSREALGTAVSITAYARDEAAARAAIEQAFDAMAAVEHALDAYDPASAVSAFNRQPYAEQALPDEAIAVLDAIDALGVSAEFSPALWSVSRLYDFEGAGRVPADEEPALALAEAKTFTRRGATASFTRASDDSRLDPGGPLAPGLDFGGAAKGLALDRAREALRASGAVSAALITAGSTTVTLGVKPDGSAWRIGIEDPREPERVVSVFQLEGEGAVSTSGDYQRYFERNGVWYHHILDPATGLPARGLRSLTVGGAGLSGLDSDILSTALFVKGSGNAAAYAAARGLGLYMVDEQGRALVVPAPEGSGLVVAEVATPRP
jgi:thiamine biosynthesis lipoprotein